VRKKEKLTDVNHYAELRRARPPSHFTLVFTAEARVEHASRGGSEFAPDLGTHDLVIPGYDSGHWCKCAGSRTTSREIVALAYD